MFQPEQAKNLAEPIINTLAPEVDFWLAETQSCLKEVETVHALLPQDGKDYWVSFTLQDEIKQEQALLRSGENMQQVADFIKQSNAKAVLFNCCQPEVILQAINEIKGLFLSLYKLVLMPTLSHHKMKALLLTMALMKFVKT